MSEDTAPETAAAATAQAAIAPPDPVPAAVNHTNEDEEEEDLFGEDEEETSPVKDSAAAVAVPKAPVDSPLKNLEDTAGEVVAVNNAQETPVPPAGSVPPVATKTTISITTTAVDPALVNLVLAAAIPKKDVVAGLAKLPNTKPTTPGSGSAPPPHMAGSIFGLSDAVKIPFSVDTKLLEGGILAKLKALPATLANDALQEYDDALNIKGGSIRNKGAYLYGVIKRYVSVHERATTGGEGSRILPMGEGLTPVIHAKLETLVTSGFSSREEMNDKVKSKIRMLSEKDALFAIDELASTDRASIRNFGSFFMGILNRYMRGDTEARNDPSPSYNPSSAGRVNRFDRNSNNNQQSYNNRDRSRDRDPTYYPKQRRDVRPPMNPTYDPRQQPRHPQQQQQHEGPPSWHNNNNHPHQGPPHQSMGYGGPPGSSNYSQSPQAYPPNNQQFVPPGGGNGYGRGLPPPPMGQSMPPQQQPPSNYGMPPQNHGYPPQQQPMMGGGQQSMMGQQQQYNTGNPPYNAPPQMYNAPGRPGPQQNHQSPPPGASYGGWQQQQPPQQQGQMLDILALADKASSAVQALTGQAPGSQRNPGPYGQNPYPYGGQSQQPQYPPPQSSYQQQQAPNYGMPNPQAMAPPYGGNPHGGRGQQGGGQQQRPRGGGGRHTTATMEMLPHNVQYAVQNLIATSQVERPPDEGILGMIFDLPEDLALASLQKFAAIDKSSMRSRIAYLAGVLRRELEKISKR